MFSESIIQLVIGVAGTVVLLSATPAFAGDPTQPNGCGTGWNAYLVPNSIKLAGCVFKPACDAHDRCYDKCRAPEAVSASPQMCAYLDCRRDGKYYGQGVCKSEYYEKSKWDAAVRRTSCDTGFYTNLLNINQGTLICEAFSWFYLKAVQKFGEGAFFGAAPVSAAREDEIPFTGTSRKAVEEFFNSGTEQQFKQLIEDLKSTRPVVDPSQPLIYDPSSGLKNDR